MYIRFKQARKDIKRSIWQFHFIKLLHETTILIVFSDAIKLIALQKYGHINLIFVVIIAWKSVFLKLKILINNCYQLMFRPKKLENLKCLKILLLMKYLCLKIFICKRFDEHHSECVCKIFKIFFFSFLFKHLYN